MKAIALLSGGLDSTLAAKIIQNLGIELIALNTKTPFCLCDRHSASGCMSGAVEASRQLGIKLVSMNVSGEFLEILKKPRHGYGANMNPCIDCRILLFRKAKELMEREGASFVITGEVLGQRPMSQRKAAMKLIDKESGVEGLVLRPLCAKFMELTIPEKKGWVDRDKLLAICGRRRSTQFSLAKEFGINDYPCPSGGCLLTYSDFSKRVKDLIKHDCLTLDNVHLLKVGRHFRLNDAAKLVVGRSEAENRRLADLAQEGDYLFLPHEDVAGATSLGRGFFNEDLIKLATRITARYCDLNGLESVEIGLQKGCAPGDGLIPSFKARPMEDTFLESLRI